MGYVWTGIKLVAALCLGLVGCLIWALDDYACPLHRKTAEPLL